MIELSHYWDPQGFKHSVYEVIHKGQKIVVHVREKYGFPASLLSQTYIAEVKNSRGDIMALGEGSLTEKAIRDVLVCLDKGCG